MADRGFPPVGVVVFGVSTTFAYWGFGVVREIVEAITDKTLHLHVSTLESLHEGFARRGGGSVVMTSDFPDADLADFVCDSGLPLIVFSDHPGTLLDWTIQSRAMRPDDAARLCSRICSSLAPCRNAKRMLMIAGEDESSSERVVADIVEFLWPGRGERLARQTFDHLAQSGKLPSFSPPEPPPASDSEEVSAALSAVAGYADLLQGRVPEAIHWPLSFFTRPDKLSWSDPIDLTGPARAVLYGPYMYLPVGEWSARVEFEIDGAVSGIEAMTDVRINEVVTEKSFVMPAKGIFAYELSFRVVDPHRAVEIRLFIKKSAIEGVFLPRSVRVTPHRPAP
jgi:hypothetical protein